MNVLFIIIVVVLISGGALAAMHGFTQEILIDCEPNKTVHWAFVAAGLGIWAVGIVVLILVWRNVTSKILKVIGIVLLLSGGAFAMMYGFSKQVISKCTLHSTADWAIVGVGAAVWILGIVIFIILDRFATKQHKLVEVKKSSRFFKRNPNKNEVLPTEDIEAKKYFAAQVNKTQNPESY